MLDIIEHQIDRKLKSRELLESPVLNARPSRNRKSKHQMPRNLEASRFKIFY